MMVSGWDKNPPPDEYQPDIGWGGRIILLVVVLVFGLGAFGWLLV